MLVVADSSPLIVLVNIERIEILPKLYGQVIIPPQVSAELTRPKRPQAVREFFTSRPSWLTEQAPRHVEVIPLLHAGECVAISLVREMNADLLLIDEIQGRQAAERRRLRITGTIGVLEMAAGQKMLDLEDAFERIKQTDFWISHKLLDERLRLHLSRGES